jgi:hypothetical protein
MIKIIFILLLTGILGLMAYSQGDTESYTAYKVTGDMVPVIDGVIEPAWYSVEKVPLQKVPEDGGAIHPNITVPNPDPSDFYAEFGTCWNDSGIFFYFMVVDDKIVIEDDNAATNTVPNDQWWTDDNINILFSKDLTNATWEQWEFAWQEGINQEEKLSSDDWLNAAKIDQNLVQSAWYNDGTTWVLETYIDWWAFKDDPTPGEAIYLEARARDDDDDGTWESMFQWSTIRYQVENDGIGLGAVTLSETELTPTGIAPVMEHTGDLRVFPNPTGGRSDLAVTLERAGNVGVTVYDMSGKSVLDQAYSGRAAGKNLLPLHLESLRKGMYMVRVTTVERTCTVKLVKE